jgi:hypothetical protein
MSVPTSPKLRQTAGMVDRIQNFGSFPPTEAYRDTFGGQGILLNLLDPDATGVKGALQVKGIRSHGLWAGVWHPVPQADDDGALRARLIDEKIRAIDAELVAQGQPKIDVVWLNFEGYTINQWRDFLWGYPSAIPGSDVKGWRGKNGARGSSGGYRWGIATGFVDEPFQDGSVKPMGDLMDARLMLAVEGFYGPTTEWVDMTPADHLRAYIDRITGQRNGGVKVSSEAWPIDQVVGCYDAALGSIVTPHEPLLLRCGLHFTLERARQRGLI